MKNKFNKLILLYGSFNPIFSIYENPDDTARNLHESDIAERGKNTGSTENNSSFNSGFVFDDDISDIGETESNYSEFSIDNFSVDMEETNPQEDSKEEEIKDETKVSIENVNSQELAEVLLNDLANNYYTDDWFQVALNFETQNKLTLESINTSILNALKSKKNVLKKNIDTLKQLNKDNNKVNEDLLKNYNEKLKSLDENKASVKDSIVETQHNLTEQLKLMTKEYDEFVKNQKKQSKDLNSAQEKARSMRMNDMKSVKQDQIKLEKTRVELINENNKAEAEKFQVEERIKAYEGNSQVNGSLNNNNDKKMEKRIKSLTKFKDKLSLKNEKCAETKRKLDEFNKTYEQNKEELRKSLVDLETENANKGAEEVEELLKLKADQELGLKNKYLEIESQKQNIKNFYKSIIENQEKDFESISNLKKEEELKNPLSITKDYETSLKISIKKQNEEIKEMQVLSKAFEEKKDKFVENIKYKDLEKLYADLKSNITSFVIAKWESLGLKQSKVKKRNLALKSYKIMQANIDLLSFLYFEGMIGKETYNDQINKSLEYNKDIAHIINTPYIKNKFKYICDKVKNKIDKIQLNFKNFFALNFFKGHISSNKNAEEIKKINLDEKVIFNKLSNLDLSRVKLYKFLEKEIEAFRRFGIDIPVMQDGTIADVVINPVACVDYLGIAKNDLTFRANELARTQEDMKLDLLRRQENLKTEQNSIIGMSRRASSQLSEIVSRSDYSRSASVYSNISRALNPSIIDENDYNNFYTQEYDVLGQEKIEQPLKKLTLNCIKINGGVDIYKKIYSNEKMRISAGPRSSIDNLSWLIGGLLMLEYSRYIIKLNIEPIGIDFYGIYLGRNRWNPSININMLMHANRNLSVGMYFGYSRNAGFSLGLSTIFFSKKFIPEIKYLSNARNGISGSIGYKNKGILIRKN